jgi:hypothetical protein
VNLPGLNVKAAVDGAEPEQVPRAEGDGRTYRVEVVVAGRWDDDCGGAG